MFDKLRVLLGDITVLTVDAIVNAANSSLLGGGGVDGAIHQAAGAELLHECRRLGGCHPGEAKITQGYRLPAKYVIHTVGPIWLDGLQGEVEQLASCYRNAMCLANDMGIKTIAFPSISTGIYGYPIELAAPIAVSTVQAALCEFDAIQEVIFCCFSSGDFQIYKSLLLRQSA